MAENRFDFDQLRSLLDDTPMCLSGGAPGADLQFGMNAGRAGHHVIHWSFDKHKSDAPPQEIIRLTDDQLSEADEALKQANQTLQRHIPWKKHFTLSLLRRNYYQIRWSNSAYAVAGIDWSKDTVVGGTGWAVEMAKNLELGIYVFDQHQESWYWWDGGGWQVISYPPKPSGIYAGIGSRTLEESGKNAIRNLYS